MRLRPSDIVYSISSLETSEFGNLAGVGEVKDMAATVADDPKVLGGGDGEAGLEEGAELHRVAVQWDFEGWHFLAFWDLEESSFLDLLPSLWVFLSWQCRVVWLLS